MFFFCWELHVIKMIIIIIIVIIKIDNDLLKEKKFKFSKRAFVTNLITVSIIFHSIVR